MSAIERLLLHGGWELDDVQLRHRENPEKFWLPPPDLLAKITAEVLVRTIFRLLTLADPGLDQQEPYDAEGKPNLVVQNERMWLYVERVEAETLRGILMNLPVSTHCRLRPGARVRLRHSDVIDVDLDRQKNIAELAAMKQCGFPPIDEADVQRPEDPLRAPTIPDSQRDTCGRAKVKPHPPWAFSRMLVGKKVQPGVFPLYGVRARPKPERRDCGWMIWSGDPDMGSPHTGGFEFVEVRELFSRHREAWQRLALPPGWCFVIGPQHEDLYEDPEALEA
jgi:hypothetical protein